MRSRHKEAKEVWVYDDAICDVCGKAIKNRGYDMSEAVVEVRIGECYPDGDPRREYTLDVCADCFMDKIKPLIERTLNVEFHEHNAEDGYFDD